MEYTELGNNIKKARKKHNFTQKELGVLIFKSEISVRKYESGRYKIPPDVLLSLCEIFDTDLKTLLGKDYDKYSKDNHIELFVNNGNLYSKLSRMLADNLSKEKLTIEKLNEHNKFNKNKEKFEYPAFQMLDYYKENISDYWRDVVTWYPLDYKFNFNLDNLSDKEIKELANYLSFAFDLKLKEISERHNSNNK